jgi:hypothetical protein
MKRREKEETEITCQWLVQACNAHALVTSASGSMGNVECLDFGKNTLRKILVAPEWTFACVYMSRGK